MKTFVLATNKKTNLFLPLNGLVHKGVTAVVNQFSDTIETQHLIFETFIHLSWLFMLFFKLKAAQLPHLVT